MKNFCLFVTGLITLGLTSFCGYAKPSFLTKNATGPNVVKTVGPHTTLMRVRKSIVDPTFTVSPDTPFVFNGTTDVGPSEKVLTLTPKPGHAGDITFTTTGDFQIGIYPPPGFPGDYTYSQSATVNAALYGSSLNFRLRLNSNTAGTKTGTLSISSDGYTQNISLTGNITSPSTTIVAQLDSAGFKRASEPAWKFNVSFTQGNATGFTVTPGTRAMPGFTSAEGVLTALTDQNNLPTGNYQGSFSAPPSSPGVYDFNIVFYGNGGIQSQSYHFIGYNRGVQNANVPSPTTVETLSEEVLPFTFTAKGLYASTLLVKPEGELITSLSTSASGPWQQTPLTLPVVNNQVGPVTVYIKAKTSHGLATYEEAISIYDGTLNNLVATVPYKINVVQAKIKALVDTAGFGTFGITPLNADQVIPDRFTVTPGARAMPGFTTSGGTVYNTSAGSGVTAPKYGAFNFATTPGVWDFNIVLYNNSSEAQSDPFPYTAYFRDVERINVPLSFPTGSNGESEVQAFTFNAKGLRYGNLLVAPNAPAGLNVYLSTSATGPFQDTPVSFPVNNNTTGAVTVYLKVKAIGEQGEVQASIRMYDGSVSSVNDAGGIPYKVLVQNAPPAIVAPTQVSYHLTFSNTTNNSTTLNWTNGNGGARAVFIAAGNPAMPPVINNTTYTANTAFGAGTQVGSSGWYCIYNGTNTSVNVTGLTAGTYRTVVVDYNGGAGGQKYLATGLAPASVTIGTPAPVAPTQVSYRLTASNLTTNGATLTWTNGNGARRAVFVALGNPAMPTLVNGTNYAADTRYGYGSESDGDGGWFCVYNGTGTTVTVGDLAPDKTFRAVVVDYNGTGATSAYLTTGLAPLNFTLGTPPAEAPTQVSYRLTFTNVTTNSTTLSWVNGNGANRAVFLVAGSSGYPPAAGTHTYTANAAFGLGSQLMDNWYCVYNGTGSSVNITNLTSGTYRAVVVDYNGTGTDTKYIAAGLTAANVTIGTPAPVAPTQVSYRLTFTNVTTSSATLTWTSGNGASRAVFLAAGNPGMPPTANGTNYTANFAFGFGSQVGSSGWYCVYNGTGNSVNIANLSAGTYRAVVVDYNGTASTAAYITSGLAPVNVTIASPTPVAPTQVAYRLMFTNTTQTGTTISWVNGNGSARAVFIAQGMAAMPPTANGTTYTANTTFGSGNQVGSSGWYCVYNDTSNTVTVSGLSPTTQYRVVVIDYNGATGTQAYIPSGLAPAYVTTTGSGSMGFKSTMALNTLDNSAQDAPEVEAANILSPNGDGKNDTWTVKNIEAYPNSVVAVFNKDGKQIFTEKGYQNQWNGNGSLVKGTYYYTIDLGNGKNLKGFITVM